jgi:hypothetical protein
MTLFLTSSPSGCPFEPGPDIPVLDTRNHFVANLRAVWPDHAVLGLAIAADPYAYEQNDEMCRVFAQSFANAHLPLTALIPCDARNAEEIGSLLPQSGFVMLCGGHVPTQNHFFAQLGLPGLFHNYHGIVLAAWMNDHVDEKMRATVFSTSGQLDSFGQIIGGPIVGLVAQQVSIPWGLVCTAFLLLPALFLVPVAGKKRD